MKTETQLPSDLHNVIGTEIARIGLVEYWFKSERRSTDTPVQIELQDGRVFVLDADKDGESLRVEGEPWRNPFPDPLTSENAAFVETHGRPVLVDVSAQQPFAGIIHQPILEIEPLMNSIGKLTGARFRLPKGLLTVSVEWDEVKVTSARAE